jgi:hypothetical protein
VDQYIAVAKIVWPIAAWTVWVNASVKKNQKDLDYLFWKLRGGGANKMRCRSVKSRLKRTSFTIRKKVHAKFSRQDTSGNA